MERSYLETEPPKDEIKASGQTQDKHTYYTRIYDSEIHKANKGHSYKGQVGLVHGFGESSDAWIEIGI